MRTIKSSILGIFFHQLLTGIANVTPQSTGTNCTHNSIAVEDEGSAYSGVKMYFGDSFCQRIIQEDVTNAVKNACNGTSADYKALISSIGLLDKKAEYLLQRLGALVLRTNITTCTKGYEYYQRDKIWYKFHSECRNWTEARLVCHEEGNCRHVWVGATDSNPAAKWKWLNGENVEPIFWDRNRPTKVRDKHCGDLFRSADYKLTDNACSNQEHFICQIV